MKRLNDASKLLNFEPNRKLRFKVFRRVDVDPNRDLDFDSQRDLSFDADRKLPFGQRGVNFRLYVCGRCETVVEGEADRCLKCNAVFKSDVTRVKSTMKVELSKEVTHTSMTEHFGKEYNERRRPNTARQSGPRCSSCGNDLAYVASRGWWYCGRCRQYFAPPSKGRRGSQQARAQQARAQQARARQARAQQSGPRRENVSFEVVGHHDTRQSGQPRGRYPPPPQQAQQQSGRYQYTQAQIDEMRRRRRTS